MLMPSSRRARRRRVVVIVLCLAALALTVAAAPRLDPPTPARTVAEVADPSGYARGTARLRAGIPWAGGAPLVPAGRPDLIRPHPDENRHSLGAAEISGDYVSGQVVGEQVLIGDVALPWTWWLEDDVAAIAGADVVLGAVAAWDASPGSRWASAFAGEVSDAGVVADGRSTVFLEPSCEGLTTANSYLFTDGGLAIDRYGTRASQILEADIGVCPRVTDGETLARAIRHEVGHVIGLAHLCDPADPCWDPEMGEGSHACRVMFWQARPCQEVLTAGDRRGLATLYPTLRPLAGDAPEAVAARAAFATVPDGAADLVVIADPDLPPASLTAAAALAARRGGPLLLGSPDERRCVAGPAVIEAGRALRRRGTLVLVGGWPEGCDRLAYDWDVTLRRVAGDDAVTAAVELADIGGAATAAVVVGAGPDGAVADDVAAAGLAGRVDAPLLVVDGPDARVASAWLAGREIAAVTVVGALDPAARDALADRSAVVQITGEDRVATARAAAAVEDGLPDAGPGVVVLTGAEGGPERLAAAPVAVREGAAPLVTGPEVDDRVRARLEALAARTGWAVGGGDLLPSPTRLAYATVVG